MNIEAARTAAYAAVLAAVNTITPVPPVQWDNRNMIDPSHQVDPYIALEFVISAREQMSLGTTKVVRSFGILALIVCVKEGSGIATVSTMLDKLCLGLDLKSFSGLNTKAARPQRPVLEKGWHIQPLAVPFWFDDLVTS